MSKQLRAEMQGKGFVVEPETAPEATPKASAGWSTLAVGLFLAAAMGTVVALAAIDAAGKGWARERAALEAKVLSCWSKPELRP